MTFSSYRLYHYFICVGTMIETLPYFIPCLFVFSDGNENKENICWWIISTDNSRRCEEVFLSVRTGGFISFILVQILKEPVHEISNNVAF